MVLFKEHPDIEAVVRKRLSDANIPLILTRWYTSVPKDAGKPGFEFPLGTVQRIGGLPAVREYMDSANIQIDVWGNSKSEAYDIVSKARVAILEMEGTTFTTPVNAYVSAVEDTLGVTWQPDDMTGRDRYLFGVYVYARSP